MLYRVCLALNDKELKKELPSLLHSDDVEVSSLVRKKNLITHLGRQNCDMFVLSLGLLEDPLKDSLDLLKNLPENPAIVLIVEADDPERRALYLSMGCDVVLVSSLSSFQISEAIHAIIKDRMEVKEEIIQHAIPLSGPRLADFVSASSAMQGFMKTVGKIVKSDSSLLILGETGVGKERLARAIHEESPRGSGPFIPINCAALPDNLLESEIFGHEQGSFTGATRTRRGAFELGHKGTIFLDEIGDMPLHLQVKLLRVIQEREFSRIGGEKPIKIDVRIMAATNRDLSTAVNEKQFRQDLYYRLSVVSLRIPALRERSEDIEELVKSYIGYLNPKIGANVSEISDEAIETLRDYEWPGNVRELINVVERAILLCDDNYITINDLPEEIAQNALAKANRGPFNPTDSNIWEANAEYLEKPWKEVRAEVLGILEKSYLSELLLRNRGKIGITAENAGMETRSLYDKMRKYGLDKKNFKENGD